jgi:hypothetical protein
MEKKMILWYSGLIYGFVYCCFVYYYVFFGFYLRRKEKGKKLVGVIKGKILLELFISEFCDEGDKAFWNF